MGTSHQKDWVMVRRKKWYGYFRRTVLDQAASESEAVDQDFLIKDPARKLKTPTRQC